MTQLLQRILSSSGTFFFHCVDTFTRAVGRLFHPLFAPCGRLLSRLERLWRDFKDAALWLRPFWIPTCILLLALFIGRTFSQAAEILRYIIEHAATTLPAPAGGTNMWVDIISILQGHFNGLTAMLALGFWAVANWYGSRLLMDEQYSQTHPPQGWKAWVDTYGPRILGCAPFLFIGIGFLLEAYGYYQRSASSHAPEWTPIFKSLLLVLLCVLMTRLFWKWATRLRNHHMRWKWADQRTKRWVVIVTGMNVVLLVLFTLWSDRALFFGTAAILFLSAGSVVISASLLLLYQKHISLPLWLFLLVWVFLIHNTNDNYAIPTSVITPERGRLFGATIEDRFYRWRVMIQREYHYDTPYSGWKNDQHPLYVVAAEGGGVRAAFWTAIVLGYLENQRPWTAPDANSKSSSANRREYYGEMDFASHVFAISGVSGGSLGAGAFDAILAESHRLNLPPQHPQTPKTLDFVDQSKLMLGQDLLSPVVAGLLYPDLVQRFLPGNIFPHNRSTALENGWQYAWNAIEDSAGKSKRPPIWKRNRFAENFYNLWDGDAYIENHDKENLSANTRTGNEAGSQVWIPSLFLNGTSVERGSRIIASDLSVDPSQFPDSEDAMQKMGLRSPYDKVTHSFVASNDIKLSTAVDMSTRFPIFSPAGRFPDGEHVVDGGYFDDSGAATAWDIVRSLNEAMELLPLIKDNIRVKVIVIRFTDNPTDHSNGPKKNNGLLDAAAPFETIINRWSASGAQYQQSIHCDITRSEKEDDGWDTFYFDVKLCQNNVTLPLPLGWMLSGEASDDMVKQLGQDDRKCLYPLDLLVASIPQKARVRPVPPIPPPPSFPGAELQTTVPANYYFYGPVNIFPCPVTTVTNGSPASGASTPTPAQSGSTSAPHQSREN